MPSWRVGQQNGAAGDFVAVKAPKNSRVQQVSTTRHLQAGRSKADRRGAPRNLLGIWIHLVSAQGVGSACCAEMFSTQHLRSSCFRICGLVCTNLYLYIHNVLQPAMAIQQKASFSLANKDCDGTSRIYVSESKAYRVRESTITVKYGFEDYVVP